MKFRGARKMGLVAAAVLLAWGWAGRAPAKSAKKAAVPAGPSPEVRAEMQRTLRFWVYDKGSDVVSDVTGLFDSKSRKITLKCELKNMTDREIHGVRGTIRFSSYFGDVIADVYVETTAVLPPGKVVGVNWDVTPQRLGAAAFNKLGKAKLKQVRQAFYPSMIVFTDGKVLK